MLRKALPSLAVAGIAVLALASPGAAAGKRDPHTFCAKTGDYCIAIHHPSASPRFLISTFSFTDPYTLCVTPVGRTRTCHDFDLHKAKFGLYRSNISWAANFPLGPGRHAVRWFKDGTQLGRTLHFTPFIVCGKSIASAACSGAPRP